MKKFYVGIHGIEKVIKAENCEWSANGLRFTDKENNPVALFLTWDYWIKVEE